MLSLLVWSEREQVSKKRSGLRVVRFTLGQNDWMTATESAVASALSVFISLSFHLHPLINC